MLSAPSVAEAVATMRVRRGQAREQRLRLKARDDGRLTARILSGGNSSPPCLKGRIEPGDGGVLLEGVIYESHANVTLPRMFTGIFVVFAAVAILLAVTGQPSPGSYICGVSAVAFGLIGYWLGRLRTGTFTYQCKDLMGKLTPLLPEARALGEDAGDTTQ